MPTVHLSIKGKVQGVFYRQTAKRIAENLSLTGWIKNTGHGDVEARITGNREHIDQFITWCKSGPEKAQVTGVSVNEETETSFEYFEVIRGK